MDEVTKGTSYTPRQAEDLLSEVMDKEKLTLFCGKHTYIASSIPPTAQGCKSCWECYYWYMIASTPPHLRAERLNQIEEMVAHAVEVVEKHEFDVKLYDRPVIHTEKNAIDD